MRFSKIKVAEIKAKINIVDYVSKHLVLKMLKPGQYQCCCCFHSDEIPSMMIYEKEQRFFCYGCNKSGDIFDLVAHFESCDFQTAVNKVAELVHFHFESIGSSAIDYSLTDAKKPNKSPYNAQKYMYERRLNLDFLDAMGCIYSPHLKAWGFPIFLTKTLTEPDYFFYRSIEAYGFRYMVPEGVNKMPFNYFQAVAAIFKHIATDLYIFEGVFDCLSFLQIHQNEPHITAVALCGLVSEDMVKLRDILLSIEGLEKTRFFWTFDNDEAGRNAQLELAFKFLKTKLYYNYFYFDNYNNHKDFNDAFIEKNFVDCVCPVDYLTSLLYVKNYYDNSENVYDSECSELTDRPE